MKHALRSLRACNRELLNRRRVGVARVADVGVDARVIGLAGVTGAFWSFTGGFRGGAGARGPFRSVNPAAPAVAAVWAL